MALARPQRSVLLSLQYLLHLNPEQGIDTISLWLGRSSWVTLYEQRSSRNKVRAFKALCAGSSSTDPCRHLPVGAPALWSRCAVGTRTQHVERSCEEEEDTAFPTEHHLSLRLDLGKIYLLPTSSPHDCLLTTPGARTRSQHDIPHRRVAPLHRQTNHLTAEPSAIENLPPPLPAPGQLNFSNSTHPCPLCTDFGRDSPGSRGAHPGHANSARWTHCDPSLLLPQLFCQALPSFIKSPSKLLCGI